MVSLTQSFSLLTLVLILLSHSPVPADAEANNTNLIAEVCNDTIDKASCLTLLNSNPPFSKAKNYLQFSRLALELSLRKGRETQGFLKGLLKRNIYPRVLKFCAFTCYDGVVGSFRSAQVELTSNDFETASYDAKVAGDGAEYCEEGLVAHKVSVPAISSRNNETLLLSSISFAAISLLD